MLYFTNVNLQISGIKIAKVYFLLLLHAHFGLAGISSPHPPHLGDSHWQITHCLESNQVLCHREREDGCILHQHISILAWRWYMSLPLTTHQPDKPQPLGDCPVESYRWSEGKEDGRGLPGRSSVGLLRGTPKMPLNLHGFCSGKSPWEKMGREVERAFRL